MNLMSVLEVKNLNLGFNVEDSFQQALFDVNFSLEKGQTLALVGESGCGKTMSAMSILNLIPKTAKITGGEIIYNGENLLDKTQKEMSKIRGGKIALIPQDPMTSLNPLYTVGDQLLEVIKIHKGLKGNEAKRQAIEAFEAVQIPDARNRLNNYPHEFSGGMKQRAVIAMALATDAQILIADEPTTALDVTIQAQIMKLLNDIKQNNQTSILLITHDLALVSENSQNIAVMYAGRIVESAPAHEFFANPNHPYSQALLKSIPSNRQTPLETIKGQPPTLSQKIDGCRFHPRCDFCGGKCQTQVPKLIQIGQNHFSACFLNEI
ncbi:ABC transporter ATP-binding protein [bacterium]|nr:ABC transporter ATP-binding protein [bacterium]